MKRKIATVAAVLLATFFAGQAVASAGEGEDNNPDMTHNTIFMTYN